MSSPFLAGSGGTPSRTRTKKSSPPICPPLSASSIGAASARWPASSGAPGASAASAVSARRPSAWTPALDVSPPRDGDPAEPGGLDDARERAAEALGEGRGSRPPPTARRGRAPPGRGRYPGRRGRGRLWRRRARAAVRAPRGRRRRRGRARRRRPLSVDRRGGVDGDRGEARSSRRRRSAWAVSGRARARGDGDAVDGSRPPGRPAQRGRRRASRRRARIRAPWEPIGENLGSRGRGLQIVSPTAASVAIVDERS